MLPVEERELDVFPRGGAREQVKTLKNETELVIANVGELIALKFGNVDAIEEKSAAGRAIEAAEDVHEGRFAGSARAHEGDEFPRSNLERNAADGVHFDFTGLVSLVDVFQPNDSLCRHPRTKSGDGRR